MSGTPFDSAALEEKLDRIFGQLTTITNRLNFHDSSLAHVETGKPDSGKGREDTHGGEDVHRDDGGVHREDREDYDGHDTERDRAWVEFRDRAVRDPERYLGSHGRSDRRDHRRYDSDYEARYDRDYEARRDRNFDARHDRDYDTLLSRLRRPRVSRL